ncbi:MAG TPA: hypothetical protein DFR83_22310, partial [Deltaproteobacteria bacterium]|nr:hypothetical protein [Deltaproteobacteria bacterium]
MDADPLQTALHLFRTGDPAAARPIFARVQRANPTEAQPAFFLGACDLKLGNPASAAPMLLRATALPRPPVQAWLYLAMARQQMGADNWREPLTRAERALPASLLVEVARCWLAGGQRQRAEQLLEHRVPMDVRSDLLRARLARRDADGSAVVRYASRAFQSAQTPADRIHVMTELGVGLDMVGRYSEAWEVFEARNQQRWTRHGLPPDVYPNHVQHLLAWWRAHDTLPAAAPDDGGPTPHFLVGFPRSGTTLTEQCLTGHPSVRSLDEKPWLVSLFAAIEQERGWSFPKDLHRLTPDDWQRLRDQYRATTGLRAHEFLLDKLPLNWVNLPLIRCLFPRSRVVVVLRDPRDACISGLMQAFDHNVSMIQFLQPERVGALYNSVRALGERFTQIPGLHGSRVWYHDLVSDQESTLRTLLDALGLPWHPGV